MMSNGHLAEKLGDWRRRLADAATRTPPTTAAARGGGGGGGGTQSSGRAPPLPPPSLPSLAAASPPAAAAAAPHHHRHFDRALPAAAEAPLRPTHNPARGSGGGSLQPTPKWRTGDGGRQARAVRKEVAAARSVQELRALLPRLADAAATPPHVIAAAWEQLARLASTEGAATTAAAQAADAELGNTFQALADITAARMPSMQFRQLSLLMWSWARLSRGGGSSGSSSSSSGSSSNGNGGNSALPISRVLLAEAAERAATCATAAEERGSVAGAPKQLARLAWGAATLGAPSPALWRRVARLSAALAPAASAADAATCMWALARARALEGDAAAALAERAAALASDWAPADLSAIVWALGAARPRRHALLEAAAAAAARLAPALAPAELSSVAWGFARLWRTCRPQQQPRRDDVLRALAAATVAAAPRMGLRQAATVAWALASLVRRRSSELDITSSSSTNSSSSADGQVWLAVQACLARASVVGLGGAPAAEVSMLLYAAAKCGGGSGSDSSARALAEQLADWALATPPEQLHPGLVALLLSRFSGLGSFGGAAGAAPRHGQLATMLAERSAALAARGAFAPQHVSRAALALGAIAAPRRTRELWLAGGSGGSDDATADPQPQQPPAAAASAARRALSRLALLAAAAAPRLRMRALADVACGYATAGLEHEEVFDAISEAALRARVLHPARPLECARLLWAFAAAEQPDERLFSVVVDSLSGWLATASPAAPAALARFSWACAATGFFDDGDASRAVAAAVARGSDEGLSAFEARDVAALAWALSTAGAPRGGPAAARHGAALKALAKRGAALLLAQRATPPQVAMLAEGLAAADAYDEQLFLAASTWVTSSSSTPAAAPLADWLPADAAALAWALARSRHVGPGQGGGADALLALATHCADLCSDVESGWASADDDEDEDEDEDEDDEGEDEDEGEGEEGSVDDAAAYSPEDACRAAAALAWGGLLYQPPSLVATGPISSNNSSSSDAASAAADLEAEARARRIAARLVTAAAADPDALEPGDVSWLAWSAAVLAAAARARGGGGDGEEDAEVEQAARAALARVAACAAGWGPGVFGADDARRLYAAAAWAEEAALPAEEADAAVAADNNNDDEEEEEGSGGDGDDDGTNPAAPPHSLLPDKLVSAGKRAAMRAATAARDAPFCRAALRALRRRAGGGGATASYALPERVTRSARGAAQLSGLGLAELLPQIAVVGDGADGAVAASSSLSVVLVSKADEARASAERGPAAAVTGWPAASAALLAGTGARVAVAAETEFDSWSDESD